MIIGAILRLRARHVLPMYPCTRVELALDPPYAYQLHNLPRFRISSISKIVRRIVCHAAGSRTCVDLLKCHGVENKAPRNWLG